MVGPSSSGRTFTGTSARSFDGVSPERRRKVRMPPATAASSTSFSVESNRSRTPRSSDTSREIVPRWRSGDTGSPDTPAGGAGSSVRPTTRAARSASAPIWTMRVGDVAMRSSERAAPAASRAVASAPVRTSALPVGAGAARQPPSVVSSSESNSSDASSTAAMPSTMQ